MRLLVLISCLLLLVGCAGPHSTGALWAQQNLEQELVIGRQTDAERVARIHAYELTLADESLAAHGELRTELQRWLARARRAGLDEESIEALILTTFRATMKEAI